MAQGSADVVAISHASLVGVRRRHPVAGIVIEPAHQQGTGSSSRPRGLAMLGGKRLLHPFEQVTIKDRGMLGETDLTPVSDFADVEAVAQKIGEGASCEGDARRWCAHSTDAAPL